MGLSSSVQQATRIARSGKATASAGEMIEERLETFRYAPLWTQVTTASGEVAISGAASALEAGLPEDTVTIHFTGAAGQSFGAFLAPGVTMHVHGDANDYLAKPISLEQLRTLVKSALSLPERPAAPVRSGAAPRATSFGPISTCGPKI